MNNTFSLSSLFPHTWFRIATSAELPAGKVLPLRYFGQDLVLFRTESGKACLLNAHCPHLGAHLGYGGTIQGEQIRCPYHGWLWCSNGGCADVPYTDKQPPKVKIRSWPVQEINGVILTYYHPNGKAPDWQIPALPEYHDRHWTPLRPVKRWKIRARLQDYMENSIDVAHLTNLHSQTFASANSDRLEIDGPILTHHMLQSYNLSTLFAGKILKEANGEVTTTYYGPAYDVSYYWTFGSIKLGMINIFTGTPIDHEYLDIQIFYSVKKSLITPFNWFLTNMVKQDIINTFEQDLPILENKILIENPPLYKEDGPLKQCRQWLKQFHAESFDLAESNQFKTLSSN